MDHLSAHSRDSFKDDYIVLKQLIFSVYHACLVALRHVICFVFYLYDLFIYTSHLDITFSNVCRSLRGRPKLHRQPKSQRKKLLIIGGGFAGAQSAKALEKLFNVVLIDTKDYFEYTPGILRTLALAPHFHSIHIKHEDFLRETTLCQQKVQKVHPPPPKCSRCFKSLSFHGLISALSLLSSTIYMCPS